VSWTDKPVQYTITRPDETGDSTKLHLNGVSLERLEIAIGLIDDKYTGYRIDKNEDGLVRFVLMIYPDGGKDRIPLPTPLDAKTMARLVYQWLLNLKYEEYGKCPDIDGSTKRGWRAYTGSWGRIDGDYHSVMAIEPEWIMFGK
jgi:hypothetical protein